MKSFLNTILKGLTTALFVILLGGFLYVNVVKTDDINLKLISSSSVNQIGTSVKNQTKDLEEEIKEDTENIDSTLEACEDTSKLIENNQETKVKEETKEVIKEETKEDQKVEIKQEEIKKEKYAPNEAVLKTVEVIKTYYGKITGYGPDCVGCSGKTAYGHDARNGNIYYQDKTFGSIRIVAGDKSLKFGTIVRIKGIGDDIIAVVLDRGGAVGFDPSKHAYFDLLYENETAALNFGQKTATFEILRNGF